jgi:hypothetical protein
MADHSVCVRHVYVTECWVTCPHCASHNFHTVGPADAPVADRPWGVRICDGHGFPARCTRSYTIQPAAGITVLAASDYKAYMGIIKAARAVAIPPGPYSCNQCSKQYVRIKAFHKHARACRPPPPLISAAK